MNDECAGPKSTKRQRFFSDPTRPGVVGIREPPGDRDRRGVEHSVPFADRAEGVRLVAFDRMRPGGATSSPRRHRHRRRPIRRR